jgi:hypothetical protein
MKTYHSTIIYTKTPLLNQFRYKDLFQILPASHLEGLPSSKLQRHYPILLQFWVNDEEVINVPVVFEEIKDFVSHNTRIIIKQDQILSLLSCLTNHLFFRYTDMDGIWGVPILNDDPGENANQWSSKWCLPFFHAPGLPPQLKIDDFSPLLYPEMEYVEHFPYYQNDPNLDMDSKRAITFPETIYLDLESYYAKGQDTRAILDTAISYAVSAIQLKSTKKTMSIVAAFTAIETMVNFEFSDFEPEHCGTCNQPQYKVAKKYRDYLLNYIGKSDKNKKKFNAYYNLRSKIVHTGQRFKTENLFADVAEDVKQKEMVDQIEILILSKMAIFQWLLKNPGGDVAKAEAAAEA